MEYSKHRALSRPGSRGIRFAPFWEGAVGPPHRDCRKNIRQDTLWHLGRKNRKSTLCASLGRRGRGGKVVGLLGGVWPADELFDVVDVDGTNH
jgi:hypothetical protein